jgi:hypothetical protein
MNDPFVGLWRNNLDKSQAWDPAGARWVHDEIGREDVKIENHDDVHDYENIIGLSPSYKIGYRARYDDMTNWVPYEVRAIVDDEASEPDNADGHSGRPGQVPVWTVGQLLAYVTVVRVNERFQYRIARNPDRSASHIMQRHLADDGMSYVSTVVSAAGVPSLIRVFDRLS